LHLSIYHKKVVKLTIQRKQTEIKLKSNFTHYIKPSGVGVEDADEQFFRQIYANLGKF